MLLISINFTPKNSHSCLKNGTLCFPGTLLARDKSGLLSLQLRAATSIDCDTALTVNGHVAEVLDWNLLRLDEMTHDPMVAIVQII